jgi:CBS domain-containing protein
MRVEEIMTTGIDTVRPGTAAQAAWDLMTLKGVHHLVVTDNTGLLGVFSNRDAGGARGAALRRERTVADLMTPGVVTVPATTPVRKAASVMRGRSIGCLVITEKSRPVGIVTVSDLLDLLGSGADRAVVRPPRPVLRHRVPHRKQHGAAKAW